VIGEEASASFFEKKEAKKRRPLECTRSPHLRCRKADKSFLLLFFKKEAFL
jgi:hypothetical protein